MDLNLVRVFVAVYETRSISAAAARLYVTPSAISQATGRLRAQFDDPLFERTGGEMRPTPVADGVYLDFREALTRIDRTLDARLGFDPATTELELRIALSELGEIGWLPQIATAIAQSAPRARLDVVALEPDRLRDWLARGTVDLAVAPIRLPDDYPRTLIKRQGYVVSTSTRHRLATRGFDLDDYRSAARIEVPSDSAAPILAAAQAQAGITSAPRLTAQRYAALPQLLTTDPDLVATIPEDIAVGWARSWPLAIHPLPFALPSVDLHLYRRRTTQHPGALDWFYRTVAATLHGQPGEFTAIHAE